jgi:protein TonB
MLISKFDLYNAEWLDLVFKNRNQQYGAYEMRAHYGNVMARAMAITFFCVGAAAATITVISHNRPVEPLTKTVIVDLPKVPLTVQPPKPKEAVQKQPETHAAKATPSVSMQNINYKPVPDNLVKEDPKPVAPDIVSGPVDVTIPNGATGVQNITDGSDVGKGGDPGPVSNEPKTIGEIQVVPEPVGGQEAWAKFLQKNLRYPITAQEQGVSGKVYMSFIIETDGHLSDISVLRKAGYGFDEESLRVLKLAPAWKPGIQNGQKVRVRYTIPINFQIND